MIWVCVGIWVVAFIFAVKWFREGLRGDYGKVR